MINIAIYHSSQQLSSTVPAFCVRDPRFNPEPGIVFICILPNDVQHCLLLFFHMVNRLFSCSVHAGKVTLGLKKNCEVFGNILVKYLLQARGEGHIAAGLSSLIYIIDV